MNDKLYRFVTKAYCIPNVPFTHCDAVLSFGYGYTKHGLPSDSIRSRARSVEIAKRFRVPIFWSPCIHLGKVREEMSATLSLFNGHEFRNHIMGEPAKNTVTEAWRLRDAMLAKSFNPAGKTIVAVSEHLHGKSVKFICESVFPESVIISNCFEMRLDKTNLVPPQRHLLGLIVWNFARHAALRAFGLDFVAKFHY